MKRVNHSIDSNILFGIQLSFVIILIITSSTLMLVPLVFDTSRLVYRNQAMSENAIEFRSNL